MHNHAHAHVHVQEILWKYELSRLFTESEKSSVLCMSASSFTAPNDLMMRTFSSCRSAALNSCTNTQVHAYFAEGKSARVLNMLRYMYIPITFGRILYFHHCAEQCGTPKHKQSEYKLLVYDTCMFMIVIFVRPTENVQVREGRLTGASCRLRARQTSLAPAQWRHCRHTRPCDR